MFEKVATEVAVFELGAFFGGEGGGGAEGGKGKGLVGGDLGFPITAEFDEEFVGFEGGEAGFDGCELGFVFGCGEVEHGRSGADFVRGTTDQAGFGDVIKRREQRVIIALGDGVEFVVVALGAGDGEAEPVGGGGVDAVEEGDVALFFGDGAALAVEEVVAVERGGDALVDGGIGQEVAGELLDAELVEGLVGVEGADDPVAPDPLEGVAVLLEAVGIGVARGIEPGQRHAFAVVRGGEQAIDEAFVGAGFFVGQEGSEFGGRGREAGEIQADAADQRRPRGLGRRGQFFGFEAGEDEAVDGILNPVFAADGRRRRARRGGERPMRRERRAFGDPAA